MTRRDGKMACPPWLAGDMRHVRSGDAVVRFDDRIPQGTHQVVDAAVLVEVLQGADDDLAGHLAGRVPAHAVGDREQPGAGVHRVLVVASHQPPVGTDGVPQGQRHRRLTSGGRCDS